MALSGMISWHSRDDAESVPARPPQIAALVLLGLGGLYLAEGAFRASWPSWLPALHAPTAYCFMLAAIAILLQTQRFSLAHRAGRVLGAAVALIGLYLLTAALRHGIRAPAPMTDVVLVLLGGALSISRASRQTVHPWLQEGLPLIAMVLTLPDLLGHLYRIRAFDKFPFDSSVTGVTATVGLLVLACGAISLSPRGGVMTRLASPGAGGRVTRRLLPAALLVPAVIGWARLEGQRAGLYDAGFGLVLFATANIVILVAVILVTARNLDRIDDERQGVVQRLREANDSLEIRVRERTDDLTAANQMLTAEVAERRRAEEQARGLLESAPDAVVVTDLMGSIVLLNDRAEKLFGRPRQNLLGRNIEELIAPQARADYAARRAQELSAPHGKRAGELLELIMTSSDNTEMDTGVTLSALRIGGEPRVFHDIRNIEWRKRAERALKASETRFRAVSDSANDAVISVDDQGAIIYTNPATKRLFGYDDTELLGVSVTTLMPERHRKPHTDGFRRVLEGGESRVTGHVIEIEGRRKDGSEFPVELSIARWQADERTYFTGIIRDISVRRAAELKIRELNGALEDRAVALEALNKELEAFSYSVSHDLRAPLRSIDGFSQALLEDCGEQINETGTAHLARIRAAAQRMGQLIDDLLKLSRVARAEVTAEAVDLTQMALQIGAELVERTGRQVDFQVAPGLAVHADPQLLRIALENLLSNAWKFTSGRTDPRIELARQEIDGAPCFFVRDNGAGFDMAYAGKLFNAFQRLHDARDFPGTGVGLATVQRILRRHGGRIWAEAAPGQGATFYLTL